jgi:hypothetical protein
VPWPAPTHERELAPNGIPLVPRSLPVLVLAGDLDSATPPGGAEAAMAQLGSPARLIVVSSSTHAVSQGDIVGCARSLVREFVRDPRRLDRLDASCAGRFPEIRATGVFPLRLADQPLPVAAASNEATSDMQRLAALAVATAGDTVTYPARRGQNTAGLRGGTIASSKKGGPRVLMLRNVRYAEDIAVSGAVTIPKDPKGEIVAEITATADDGARVRLTARWSPLAAGAVAAVQGTVVGASADSDRLRVTMPAP